MLSKLSISRVCENGRTLELSTHAWVYIPSSAGLLEGFDRWSEGSSVDHMLHERSAWTSKDHPSRSNGRTMVEPYLSITSKDPVYPSRLSFDQNIFQMLSKSNRRIVDLVNLQYKSGHRLYQTGYRQSTDTSAPTLINTRIGGLSLLSRKYFCDVLDLIFCNVRFEL
ncbi:hypothetical protein HanXRQr2_Chr09g0366351 [Helianthus annuus]|uniref:Uncharacterized protein n=1 Tax=Helianthus annuus TaxID=4232 RepID=A0A9K3N7B3_HELAN|nr:hypothetical protein HanXRQr2_Chr09g0366351 [Helianthus annuus]